MRPRKPASAPTNAGAGVIAALIAAVFLRANMQILVLDKIYVLDVRPGYGRVADFV